MQIQFTLTASQADTLEDALLTFQPHIGLVIRLTVPQGDRGRYEAHIATESLPAARAALLSYQLHIAPKSRAVGQLVQALQGGNPT